MQNSELHRCTCGLWFPSEQGVIHHINNAHGSGRPQPYPAIYDFETHEQRTDEVFCCECEEPILHRKSYDGRGHSRTFIVPHTCAVPEPEGGNE